MTKFKGWGRKDTGRTDKYSDESPKKDFADYRKDNPKEKTARKQKKKNPVDFHGGKSLEVRKQELISHIQNMPEFFENSVKQNIYFDELDKLTQALK